MEKNITPVSAIHEQVQLNIFGYEPVIMMELQTVKSDISIETKQVIQGVPQKNIMEGKEFEIKFYDKNGVRQHTLPMSKPGELFIHGNHEEGQDQLISMPSATYRFAVPLEADIKTIKYKYKEKTSAPISVK